MPPAARVGDVTSHNKIPLGPGPGSPNVLIEGAPAWRASYDVHLCPLADGLKPHQKDGKVEMGSRTVFINGRPAARQGDIILESGLPNTIDSGAPTVLIG